VNICNGGGSIIAFTDASPFRKEEQPSDQPASNGEWLDYCRARERHERAAAGLAGEREERRANRFLRAVSKAPRL